MYFLPLDQRVPWHLAAVTAAKRAVYDGFRAAISAAGIPMGEAGVIVDECSGAPILRDAATRGLTTACALGRVGDGGSDSAVGAAHAATCDATYWRAVVCYNPDGDGAVNGRQASRLKLLADTLRHRPGPRLMCDLVVPPTQRQLAPGIRAYDRDVLPGLTKRAISQLLDAGVDPDAWVIEGLERQDDYRRVVATAARSGQPASCFVRGAGHGERTTRALMTVGLLVPGINGVVLARAPFWETAVAWMSGRTSRAAAVATVSAQVRGWVSLLEAPRPCAVREGGAGESARRSSTFGSRDVSLVSPSTNSSERRDHDQSDWSHNGRAGAVAGRDSSSSIKDHHQGAAHGYRHH